MIFDRVVCGIDPGPESLEAVRQAARLVSPEGTLALAAIVETQLAVHAGFAAADVIDRLRADAEVAIEAARREVEHLHSVETRILEGPPMAELLMALEQERATMVVIGTHGHRRLGAILLGSVAATMLHDAPCAVLIARACPDADVFPTRVIVGVDGSNEAETAVGVASGLRERFGSALELVVAGDGKTVDATAVQAAHPDVTLDMRKPVPALVERSRGADLLVLGSRGLHGLRALGSVSERVAHEATCSVLVVR